MWTEIVRSSRDGRGMNVEAFRAHVGALTFRDWRPSFLVLHNTGAPTLTQWKNYPAGQRILNLENYYKGLGWSAGPHGFVADDLIWPFTPFTARGVHSPSFNGVALGIEMVGNYVPGGDDPTSGDGLKVYRNMVAVFSILSAKLGLEPATIRFHRDDPRTTHRCPGDRMHALKTQFIEDVHEHMGEAGDHPLDKDDAARPREGSVNATDGLNLREQASTSSPVKTVLPLGARVAILGEAMNGSTAWFRVWHRDAASLQWAGWVAARYVTAGPQP